MWNFFLITITLFGIRNEFFENKCFGSLYPLAASIYRFFVVLNVITEIRIGNFLIWFFLSLKHSNANDELSKCQRVFVQIVAHNLSRLNAIPSHTNKRTSKHSKHSPVRRPNSANGKSLVFFFVVVAFLVVCLNVIRCHIRVNCEPCTQCVYSIGDIHYFNKLANTCVRRNNKTVQKTNETWKAKLW